MLGMLAAEDEGKTVPLPHRAVLPEAPRGYHRAEGPRTRGPVSQEAQRRTRARFGRLIRADDDPPARGSARARRDSGVEMSVPRLLEAESREEEMGRVAGGGERLSGIVGCRRLHQPRARNRRQGRERRSFELRDRGAGLRRPGRGDEAGGPRAAALASWWPRAGSPPATSPRRGSRYGEPRLRGHSCPGIVPVWILPEENDFPGLPYVIFPGNVGGPGSLAQAIEILRGER